ncbi:substrate-binding domain-containing protein [Dactylosporangium sp. NPDC050588]|uniref:substrate-binding domain-containing protein n=1 Tax=Dactylosporangium sp. NPDC050588 TaxID=3157211 RepID=UPI0033E96431
MAARDHRQVEDRRRRAIPSQPPEPRLTPPDGAGGVRGASCGVTADTVIYDNAAGIGTAFGHLTSHGHRRIAYIGDAERIFTGRDSTTLEVLRHLGPDAGTLAIVGFDDFPLADLLRPGVTVVAQDSDTIGRTAIDLLRLRAADHGRPVQTVTVDVRLIPRGSGERPPPD